MKSRNIKTRLAAFGLALLMGHSPLGNLADVHAAETKNPSEPVTESAEISETEQTEEVSEAAKHLVTAEDITKDISDKDFMVETCMEGIHYNPEKEDVTLERIEAEDGGSYHPDQEGTYIATYWVVPKDARDSYSVSRKIILTDTEGQAHTEENGGQKQKEDTNSEEDSETPVQEIPDVEVTVSGEEADAQAREYIAGNYGENYIAGEKTTKKNGAKIQDAHEAIRPSDINRTPVMVKESLSRDQFRLYQLIWKRFTASRMAQAVYETTNVKIGAGEYRFTVSASKIAFDGFMSVYTSDDDEKAENNVLVGSIDENTVLNLKEFDEKQHFTQPPAHYTEASLVKTLEELGIGRPSTYSPTITTLLGRRYIVKEAKNLYVTELGEVVNQIMKESFPSIVDEHFTANMESLLDGVEEGNVNWKTVVRNFYPDLDEAVKAAQKDLEKVKIEDEVTDVICDVCGRNMVVKYGPHGKFLACPGFPECRNTKPYLEKIGVTCPKCGKEVVLRKTKKGRKYFGCEDNPECDFMSWSRPVAEKCPKCGGYMVIKGNKIVCADEQCGYVTDRKNVEKDSE